MGMVVMQLCVCGRRPRSSALWLRASLSSQPSDNETLGSHHKSNHVLLEAKVEAAYSVSSERRKWRSRTIRVPLDAELLVDGAVLQVELWAAEASQSADTPDGDDNDAFLSLVGAACVDPKRWREAADCTAKRWYPLQRTRATTPEVEGVAESAFEELEERLRAGTTYVRATLVGMASKKKTREKETEGAQEGAAAAAAASETSRSKLASLSSPALAPPTTEEDNFRFTLPSHLVTKNRRFLMTRVGEILFEGDTAQLRELLPVVLYGKAPSSSSTSVSDAKKQRRGEAQCLDKSLQLLQLSCQYACYCTNKLEDNVSAVEAAREKLVQRMLQLQAARRQMMLRRRNLRRELQVLDSSLDGMQMLLQEVDPDCHERLLSGDAVQR